MIHIKAKGAPTFRYTIKSEQGTHIGTVVWILTGEAWGVDFFGGFLLDAATLLDIWSLLRKLNAGESVPDGPYEDKSMAKLLSV